MKRLIFVLAVVLMFIVSLSSKAWSRSQPFDAHYPYIDKDDHTWGGENDGGVHGFRTINEPPTTGGSLSFKPFEVFLNTILIKWWLPNYTGSSNAQENPYYAVPIQQDSETKQLETNTTNKGN